MSTTVEVVSFPSTSLAYYPFHFVTKQEDLCSSGHMEAQHGSSSIDQPEVSFEEPSGRRGPEKKTIAVPRTLPSAVASTPTCRSSPIRPKVPSSLRLSQLSLSSTPPPQCQAEPFLGDSCPTGVPPPPHATSPALAEDERPAKRRRAKSDWKEVPFRCDWEGCASTIPDSVAWQAHMEIAHNIPKADWSSRTERRCLHTRCVAARRGKAQAGTTYGEFPTLLRHYRTKHQLQELFRCSVPGCRAEFNRKDALGRHEKSCGSKNTAKENEPPVVDSEVDSDMGGDDESEEKLYERPPLDEDYDAE
ncbi:hypothetical protein BD414DRAFT_540044 [Trametes punicea]|nr:hypothetical protein BD414DRAFT_540044 [Trametes punicea]